MGTTMVQLWQTECGDEKVALVANVGDSAYLIRDETLHQISKDHSLVARMVGQNQITQNKRERIHTQHPMRTVGTEKM